MPASTEMSANSLTWETLIARLDACLTADHDRLAKNRAYLQDHKESLATTKQIDFAQRIDNESIRLCLLDELLDRLRSFPLLAMQRGMDLANKHMAGMKKPLPDRYQLIITISETRRTVNVYFNPLIQQTDYDKL